MSERWIRQTKRGGGHAPPEERGDCVPACLASVLGLPLEAIPNDHHACGTGWWARLQDHVEPFGYAIVEVDLRFEPPPGYWIATVPSLNLPPEPDGKPAWHVVVAKGYELVHDPSSRRRYSAHDWVTAWNDGKVREGWVLAPLDPADLNENGPPGREDQTGRKQFREERSSSSEEVEG